ncbi:MAG TPA: protein kinase, partial [Phycisphaerales bacterium]|nr:protein kinase [Phycisphaerales bacterium]
MDPQRWQRIEQLYEAAEALDTGARTSLLERECAGDDDLRREVESLLAANKSAEGFLEKPAFIVQTPPPLRSLTDDLPASMVGRRLGAYHITGVIGSGGMGVVYLAEQDFPRRSVALKVVKPSLATPSMVRRFEHEAQILGRLHHPGIAQIYEAGAAPDHDNPIGSGVRAFFAMEYVKGRTITDFATTNNLSTNKKLELFSKVCDALQHAHQRGVIHRDLKPANILVDESALSAGHTDTTEAQPKILDFGVARLTDADRRVTTMRTSMGQLIGTLPYMSPEQVAGDQDNIDTRSDVYALGVVLYELLSGKLPHDLSARSIPEAARIIRDDEPVRLSSISRVFRGEIDTIVNKAIDKDRARRYQSASDLADDIRRYLRGEPIAAKRDSALYVLRKQLNRYRGAVAAAALFIVSLIVFAIVMFVQSRENQRLAAKAIAERERAVEALTLAESERARADRTSFRLADQLTASTIEHGRLAGLLGNAALAKDLLWPEFFRDPNSRHAYWALWEFYLREPCVWTLKPHSDYIPIALFTPDERTICSGSRDGTIAATDFATLTHLVTAPATEGAVVGMAM